MSEEISAETIAENAAKPQSASGDGEAVSQFSISDQIAADRYRRDQQARDSKVMPFQIYRIKRPGTA